MSEPRDSRSPGDRDPASSETVVEQMLRTALESRANQIGVHDLSPAAPPMRTVRRSRRLYTVALPLIGLAAAGAVGYVAFDHTVDTADRTVQPAVTVTATPGPTATPTAQPSVTASPTGTVTATDTPTTGTTTTGSATATPPGSGVQTGADAASGQYLASTWLRASEYPLDSAFRWKSSGASTPRNTTGAFQWLWSCGTGSPTSELHTVSISMLDFTAGVHAGTQTPQAGQVMFYFKDPTAASKAMARIQQDYTGCAANLMRNGPTDLTTGKAVTWTITRTASIAQGFSYRSVAREAGGNPADMPDLPPDLQEMFVRSGNVVTLVQIQGFGAQLDPAGDAPRTLATMATRLGNFPR